MSGLPMANDLTYTALRTPNSLCDSSGMCASCSQRCAGTCEIGLSALRGSEAAYPYDTASRQFASRKSYPFDFSHFNINGRVFGAQGAPADMEHTTPGSVDLNCAIGSQHPILCRAPLILPAIAKLNWRDYYAGAAMAGVPVVIGENAVKNDPTLEHDANGRVSHAPFLLEMADCFHRFDQGYGTIILQVNADDLAVGSGEYALKQGIVTAIEIKFGQAAKGIQHVAPASYEEALWLKRNGYLVEPDPEADSTKQRLADGEPISFFQYGRLPMFDEASIHSIIQRLRDHGAKHIFFKMAGYDQQDIRRVLEMAVENQVDLVTFDGAGGGTGHSPLKMMDEWGWPTVELERIVTLEAAALHRQGKHLPAIAMAGGLATEDAIFKVLALGAPFVTHAATGRGAMAAAMAGQQLEHLIQTQQIPAQYQRFGTTREALFRNWEWIQWRYPDQKDNITGGAVGVYSYLERLSFGLRLLMSLNRKFQLPLLSQEDLLPLTDQAKDCLTQLHACLDNLPR